MKTAGAIAWVVLMAVIIGYELWCVLGHDPYTPPLTSVVVKLLPSWVTMPFLVWLVLHFAIRYAKKGTLPL